MDAVDLAEPLDADPVTVVEADQVALAVVEPAQRAREAATEVLAIRRLEVVELRRAEARQRFELVVAAATVALGALAQAERLARRGDAQPAIQRAAPGIAADPRRSPSRGASTSARTSPSRSSANPPDAPWLRVTAATSRRTRWSIRSIAARSPRAAAIATNRSSTCSSASAATGSASSASVAASRSASARSSSFTPGAAARARAQASARAGSSSSVATRASAGGRGSRGRASAAPSRRGGSCARRDRWSSGRARRRDRRGRAPRCR